MANKNTVALTLEQYKEVINTMRSGELDSVRMIELLIVLF